VPSVLSKPSPPPSGAPRSGESAREPKLIVIAGRCGRLGNRITLFASFAGWVAEYGYRLINCTFHSYAHLFEATRRDIYCQFPPRQRRSWLDIIPGVAPALRKTRLLTHLSRYTSILNERGTILNGSAITLRDPKGNLITWLETPEVEEKIRPTKTVFINAWTFRAPRCVEKHAEAIRAYFRPIAELERASRAAVQALRQRADLLVGVHVRYGDYRGWKKGKYLFPIERYVAWMQEMAQKFPGRKVGFLICSDEPRTPEEFPGLIVGLGPGAPVPDMYALAECDYIIGPVSSFTQWSSFYGNKPLLQLSGPDTQVALQDFRVCFLGEIPN
jgi:hypothetical protein